MDIPDTYLNQIVTGDARKLAKAIPDESVDLIFTDPVYQNIDDYRWLAETAARVLKPNSAALVFCGIGYIDRTLDALRSGGLTYRWICPVYQPTISRRADAFFGLWYPLIIAEKGRLRFQFTPQDLRVSKRFQCLPANHEFHWTKDPDVIAYYIRSCCESGVVLDPFSGGGTIPAVCKMLGRNFVAFEIDPSTAVKARQRLLDTQVPLFIPEPEQLTIDDVAA